VSSLLCRPGDISKTNSVSRGIERRDEMDFFESQLLQGWCCFGLPPWRAGVVFRLVASVLLKRLHDPTLSIIRSLLMAWACYIGADAIGVSGVLSTVTCGLVKLLDATMGMRSTSFMVGRANEHTRASHRQPISGRCLRMTAPHLRVVGNEPMSDDRPSKPFFLVVADHDQGFFSVEGPMTDDQSWNNAARHARDNLHRHVVCGPAGPDRDALAAEFQRAEKLAGVPPGSIVRPRS
jgi:hypothetical protein